MWHRVYLFTQTLCAQKYTSGWPLYVIGVDKEQLALLDGLQRGVLLPVVQPFWPGRTHTAGEDDIRVAVQNSLHADAWGQVGGVAEYVGAAAQSYDLTD